MIVWVTSQLEEGLQIKTMKEKDNLLIELVSHNLAKFTFKEKRMALEALNIKVWIDNDCITAHGVIPIPEGDIVSQPL